MKSFIFQTSTTCMCYLLIFFLKFEEEYYERGLYIKEVKYFICFDYCR